MWYELIEAHMYCSFNGLMKWLRIFTYHLGNKLINIIYHHAHGSWICWLSPLANWSEVTGEHLVAIQNYIQEIWHWATNTLIRHLPGWVRVGRTFNGAAHLVGTTGALSPGYKNLLEVQYRDHYLSGEVWLALLFRGLTCHSHLFVTGSRDFEM